MNRRLEQFLAAENISQAQFAETIGVARASISHILSGRNKPGFDFIESTARHFPALNLEWLITGRGRMYNSPNSASDATPAGFSPLPASEDDALFPDTGYRRNLADPNPISPQNTLSNRLDNNTQQTNIQKSISKIIIFYSDGSFQEIE